VSGTRKRVKEWKSGFYHIASGANVPVVLGFLDFKRKTGGIGPVVTLTGDMEQDMKGIRAFYSNIEGKYKAPVLRLKSITVKSKM